MEIFLNVFAEDAKATFDSMRIGVGLNRDFIPFSNDGAIFYRFPLVFLANLLK